MSVMVSLGNPRTMEEIKVGASYIFFVYFFNVKFQEMIAEEDPDGDGVITKDEFTKMLDKNNRKSKHCNNVSSLLL